MSQLGTGLLFANYILRSVGEGSRIRPTSEMWQEAASEFPTLLDAVKPRNIVVLGKEMWRLMPDVDVWLTDDVQAYRASDGTAAMCWAVNHPSAGLSWRRLTAVIRFALDLNI